MVSNLETQGSKEQLMDLVYKDELTQIYNRRFFNRRIKELAQNASREKKPLSFLMIDVDHFKGFNDTYGHELGDKVLVIVANCIEKGLGDEGTAVRYAGDEFVGLIPSIDKKKAREIAERVRKLVAEEKVHVEKEDKDVNLTLSVGLATYPDDTEDAEEIKNEADKALYISKKLGRNRVSTIDQEAPETLDSPNLYRYFPCRTLVGRDDVMQVLKPIITPGPREKRPFMVLTGLPGAGKSRVLSELSAVTDKNRTFIIKTQGSAFTVGQPFGEILAPLSEILEKNPEISTKVIPNMDPAKLRVIMPFLPILSRFVVESGKKVHLEASQKKEALLDGLKEIILAVSSERPFLIFFDDFHLSNLGTRMLLEKVKRDKGGNNVALFASLCDVEMVKNKDADLLNFVKNLSDSQDLEKIPLKPLNLEQAGELLDNVVKDLSKEKTILDPLFKNSEGNPGKIEDILKKLIFNKYISIVEGKLKVESISDGEFAQISGAKIGVDSMAVDDEMLSLLSKASVVGQQFNMDILKKLDDRGDGLLYDILEKAEKADIITHKTVGDEEVFEFRGDEVKQELYEKLEEPERKELHKQTAEAEKELNADNPDAVLGKLAYHFDKAGDNIQSLGYISQLAQQFRGFFAPETVEVYLGQKIPSLDDWGEEKALSLEDQEDALSICRRFKTALGNLAKYPDHSEIVRGSLGAAFMHLKKVLEKLEILSYSDAEGTLLINNSPVGIEDRDTTQEVEFLEILNTANLKGIAFRKGFSKEEFVEILRIIIAPPTEQIEAAGGWNEFLKSQKIHNIQVNQRVFVTLGQKDLMAPQRIKKRRLMVRGHLQEDTGEMLEDGGFSPNLPEEMAQKMEMVKEKYSKDPELLEFISNVQQALDALGTQQEKIDAVERNLEKMRQDKERLEKETSEAVKSAKIAAAPQAAPGASQAAAPAAINAAAISRDVEQIRQYSSRLKAIEMVILDKIKEDTDVLIQEINYPDPEVAQTAASALLNKGREAVKPLFEYLINNSENMIGRKYALETIKRLDSNILRNLMEALMGNTNASQKEIILHILRDFSGVPLFDVGQVMIRDTDSRVRRSFLSIFEEKPAKNTFSLLIECLEDSNEDVVSDVIYSLGRLKCTESIPYLVKMVSKKWIIFNDVKLKAQETACKVLGQLGGEESLKALSKVFKVTPSIFLKRNKPDQVRAAAVFAMGYYPIDQVEKFLKQADRDFNPVVRSAAGIARSLSADIYKTGAQGKTPNEIK